MKGMNPAILILSGYSRIGFINDSNIGVLQKAKCSLVAENGRKGVLGYNPLLYEIS